MQEMIYREKLKTKAVDYYRTMVIILLSSLNRKVAVEHHPWPRYHRRQIASRPQQEYHRNECRGTILRSEKQGADGRQRDERLWGESLYFNGHHAGKDLQWIVKRGDG